MFCVICWIFICLQHQTQKYQIQKYIALFRYNLLQKISFCLFRFLAEDRKPIIHSHSPVPSHHHGIANGGNINNSNNALSDSSLPSHSHHLQQHHNFLNGSNLGSLADQFSGMTSSMALTLGSGRSSTLGFMTSSQMCGNISSSPSPGPQQVSQASHSIHCIQTRRS